jgi:hypothetical protein
MEPIVELDQWLEQRQMEIAARLAKLEPCHDFRVHLVERAMDEWGTDEDRDDRFRAAHDLLYLGYYGRQDSRDEVNDAKRYETFAPIAGLVRQLVIMLDNAEYNEYCEDVKDGVPVRDARKLTKQAKALAKAIAAWEKSL